MRRFNTKYVKEEQDMGVSDNRRDNRKNPQVGQPQTRDGIWVGTKSCRH